MFQNKRLLARVFGWAVLLVTGAGVLLAEDVKKTGLSIEEANAEILTMQDRGFLLVDMDVKGMGQPTFELTFTNNPTQPHRIYLACDRATLEQELRAYGMRGGLRFKTIHGFNPDGKDPRFAVLIQIHPPGTNVGQGIFVDVPAQELNALVNREHMKGGRFVKHSTYFIPNGQKRHTAIFE